MGLKTKLDKLEERVGALAEVVPLDDGSTVSFPTGARFACFLAVMDDHPHPLLELLPRLAEHADTDLQEMASFVRAFRGDEVEG